MGKSIHPMFTSLIRGEASSGSAPNLIVWMSLQPAIPWRVALLQWDTRPVSGQSGKELGGRYAYMVLSVGSQDRGLTGA
jgi:hypothetical protein